jgi:hypothetical protein
LHLLVDQNIYARLLTGDLSRYPFHFVQAREIGKMYRMGDTRGAAAQLRKSRLSASPAARHGHDASAHFGECQWCGYLANSVRSPSDDNSFGGGS